MNVKGIQEILSRNESLKDKIFNRGFLFTDDDLDLMGYPFYGKWYHRRIHKYQLYLSPKQQAFCISNEQYFVILVGHAYNPFAMVEDENDILSLLLSEIESFKDVGGELWEKLNELTGIFTIIICHKDKDAVTIIGDATGMQTTFYGVIKGNVYVSSHTNLIGDVAGLIRDDYINRLAQYPFFPLLGNSLPGDLTQFKDIKRLVPNHYVTISMGGGGTVTRFYWPVYQEKSENYIVNKVSELLYSNMVLISKKWKRPAISLTGGCDSKTTLACTNGLYDKFSYFSYVSSDAENVDAVAAEKICKSLQLSHHTYLIPETDQAEANDVKEIVNWNTGDIRYSNANDIRKRIFFTDTDDFDVEVKSWASEIGRAYYSKRFNGRVEFGKEPTPRKCTTLYKFFFNNRKLVKETDKVFAEYLSRYFERADQNSIEWQEQFFWEFRVPSWNGLVITGEHRYSFDITIPYNNRKILELLLSVPIEDRITDKIYQSIRKKMNPHVDQTGIAVVNLKHTKNRAKVENLYYTLHSKFPF